MTDITDVKYNVYCGKCKMQTSTTNIVDISTVTRMKDSCFK